MRVVEVPTPLPLPGQLKPLPEAQAPASGDPAHVVAAANRAARIEPARDGFIDAMQVWPYSDGALYQVYASPGRVTDIALQPGEALVSVSAGDTVRWIIGDTETPPPPPQRPPLLVHPSRPALLPHLATPPPRPPYPPPLPTPPGPSL